VHNVVYCFTSSILMLSYHLCLRIPCDVFLLIKKLCNSDWTDGDGFVDERMDG